MRNVAIDGPEEADKYVGHQLRLRRKELDMSQQALAEASGVTFQQIQKYERGANRVSASMMVRLATKLGVRPGFFLDGAPGALGAALGAADAVPEAMASPPRYRALWTPCGASRLCPATAGRSP